MSPRAARLAVIACVALGLVACGKKGPPIAPERRLPVPPTALSTFIDEGSVLISWINPGARFDGSSLKDLTEVKLYRRHESDGEPMKPAVLSRGRVVGYDELATIRLDSPAPATVQGTTVRWIDREGLVLGERYVYVVTAVDSLGRSSPPSERRAITFLAAPKPPAPVQLTAGNAQITLTWTPPSEFTDGSPASGEIRYIVLRGSGTEGPLSAITPQPLAETSFTDTGLDNDVEYRYAVRALRLDPRATSAGPPSSAVAATPRSTTPPRPPSNLVGVPSPGALRLAWNPSPAPNVALYSIYRAVGDTAFVRIASTAAGNTTYIDRDIRPGTVYRYAVTAIDNARQPNESARSNEITLTAQ